MGSDEAAPSWRARVLDAGPARIGLDRIAPRITRRELLAGAALGGLAACLAACGATPPRTLSPASPTPGATPLGGPGALRWASWSGYLDYDAASRTFPTLDAFRERHGIAVKYQEIIVSNDAIFERLEPRIEAGDDPGFDLVVVTDWMAARLIRLGWAEPLDLARMPNVAANLLAQHRSPVWDSAGDHQVPWLSGMTGIAFEPGVTGELTSLAALFTADPRWKGRASYLPEMRDVLGLAMLAGGADASQPTRADADRAAAKLSKAVAARVPGAGKGSAATQLAAGVAVLAMAWSGEIARAQIARPSLRFVIPDEGGLLWTDHLLVPKGSPRKADAELLIDFCYQPEVAARITAHAQYLTPVQGVHEALAETNPDLAGNPLLFPGVEETSRLRRFGILADGDEAYFNQVVAGIHLP